MTTIVVFCPPCSGKTSTANAHPDELSTEANAPKYKDNRFDALVYSKINILNISSLKKLKTEILNGKIKAYCILPGPVIYGDYVERAFERAIIKEKHFKEYSSLKKLMANDFQECKDLCKELGIKIKYLTTMTYDLYDEITRLVKE